MVLENLMWSLKSSWKIVAIFQYELWLCLGFLKLLFSWVIFFSFQGVCEANGYDDSWDCLHGTGFFNSLVVNILTKELINRQTWHGLCNTLNNEFTKSQIGYLNKVIKKNVNYFSLLSVKVRGHLRSNNIIVYSALWLTNSTQKQLQ